MSIIVEESKNKSWIVGYCMWVCFIECVDLLVFIVGGIVNKYLFFVYLFN